jgi:hypothetical protein
LNSARKRRLAPFATSAVRKRVVIAGDWEYLLRFTQAGQNMQQAAAPKVSFVSLGCPKALVDSERIITRLRAEGYELAR